MALIQEKVHRIFLARKKKTTALAALLRRTVILLCGFSPWSAIEILFKEMR